MQNNINIHVLSFLFILLEIFSIIRSQEEAEYEKMRGGKAAMKKIKLAINKKN